MTKPGPKPSLISGSTGKPMLLVTKNKHTCSRCPATIEGGCKCFKVPKLGSGFSHKKPYCKSCFKELLDQTRKDLEELEVMWSKI